MVAGVVAWRRGSGENHWFTAGGPPHTAHRSSVSSESRCSSLLWSMSSMARTTSAALYTGSRPSGSIVNQRRSPVEILPP
jgi:hypothetical protein